MWCNYNSKYFELVSLSLYNVLGSLTLICICVPLEAHPVLLFGEVHSKLGRSSCKDSPTQKWGGYELHNMRKHLLLWCLAYLCDKFNPVHSFTFLNKLTFRKVDWNNGHQSFEFMVFQKYRKFHFYLRKGRKVHDSVKYYLFNIYHKHLASNSTFIIDWSNFYSVYY